ncbi:hypothetical protein [Methylobacterium sp. Gmos1]
MSEGASDQKPTNPVVKWLGIATAVVLGAAGLIEGLKKLDDAYELWTPKLKPVPTFPRFYSKRVPGGHTADEFCKPQRDVYAQQNPDFDITYIVLPTPADFDFFRHATYVFQCEFVAKQKSK